MVTGAHAERSKLKRECMKVCSYDAFELNGSWMESDTVVANLLRDRDYFEMRRRWRDHWWR